MHCVQYTLNLRNICFEFAVKKSLGNDNLENKVSGVQTLFTKRKTLWILERPDCPLSRFSLEGAMRLSLIT